MAKMQKQAWRRSEERTMDLSRFSDDAWEAVEIKAIKPNVDRYGNDAGFLYCILYRRKPTEEIYRKEVVRLIRNRYSVDEEIAILRQRDAKPEEFAEYNAYAEQCKAKAKEEIWK